MRELMKRLDRLEAATPNGGGAVILLHWQMEPTYASASGERIERGPEESAEAFKARAAAHFKPVPGRARFVWMG